MLWQSEQRPVPYGAYQVAQTFLTAVATILFVVVFRQAWTGQLIGMAIGWFSFAVLSLFFLMKRGYLSLHFNWSHVRDALAFGVPLIPHALSGWVLTGIDRLLLMSLVGPSATGLYSVGYQFGLVISVLATAFNKAWMPFLFSRLDTMRPREKLRIVRITYAYFGVILVLAFAMGLVAPPIAAVLLGPRFQASVQFVVWICVGYAFDGMYFMVVNPLFYLKKTTWLAWLTFAVGAFHVVLSYALIRLNGPIGAAQTTVLSFLLMFLLAWWLSARAYAMPWGLRISDADVA